DGSWSWIRQGFGWGRAPCYRLWPQGRQVGSDGQADDGGRTRRSHVGSRPPTGRTPKSAHRRRLRMIAPVSSQPHAPHHCEVSGSPPLRAVSPTLSVVFGGRATLRRTGKSERLLRRYGGQCSQLCPFRTIRGDVSKLRLIRDRWGSISCSVKASSDL